MTLALPVEIVTDRLRMVALSFDRLRDAVETPEQLTQQLGCDLDQGAISDASRRAISVKLEKMRFVSEEMHPWYTYWLLILKEGQLGVGMAGFKGAPGFAGEVEIGYGISPNYQNRGLMTEAVRGLVKWACAQSECRAVTAETLKNNPASQHVLRKNGFHIVRETEIALYWWIKCQS